MNTYTIKYRTSPLGEVITDTDLAAYPTPVTNPTLFWESHDGKQRGTVTVQAGNLWSVLYKIARDCASEPYTYFSQDLVNFENKISKTR